jgi:hypothetical protein
VATGCTHAPSTPAPDHAAFNASLQRAQQEVSASNTPQAQGALQAAQKQMNKSQELTRDGKEVEADRMAQRAAADADLAAAIVRTDNARRAAGAANEQLRMLGSPPAKHSQPPSR